MPGVSTDMSLLSGGFPWVTLGGGRQWSPDVRRKVSPPAKREIDVSSEALACALSPLLVPIPLFDPQREGISGAAYPRGVGGGAMDIVNHASMLLDVGFNWFFRCCLLACVVVVFEQCCRSALCCVHLYSLLL
jgi:hypothetical protein